MADEMEYGERRWPAAVLAKYPHMGVEEIGVWENWLSVHAHEYEYFLYDVRVGEGVDPGPLYTPEERRMWKMLTQRRIDAVGVRKGKYTIFEVKLEAGASALGEAILYRELWKKTFPNRPLEDVIVVHAQTRPDIEEVLKRYDIRSVSVEEELKKVGRIPSESSSPSEEKPTLIQKILRKRKGS
jgi:hypothetical protein